MVVVLLHPKAFSFVFFVVFCRWLFFFVLFVVFDGVYGFGVKDRIRIICVGGEREEEYLYGIREGSLAVSAHG